MSQQLHLVQQSSTGAIAVTKLHEGEHFVGRLLNCDVCLLSDNSISRQHAKIEVRNGSVTVYDLKSTNGTYINDQRIQSAPLAPNQEVRFGDVRFRLISRSSSLATGGEDVITVDPKEAKIQRALKHPLVQQLSEAEQNVFVHLLTALTEEEISHKIHRAKATVHNHTRQIYRVFDVHSRAELLCKVHGGPM